MSFFWSKRYFCIPTSYEGGHSGPCSDRVVEFLIGTTNPPQQQHTGSVVSKILCCGFLIHLSAIVSTLRKTWYVSGKESRSRSIHFV